MKIQNALIGETTIATSIAQEILTTNLKIPTLSTNWVKILAIARQPINNIDTPSFVKLVNSDPGLFTKILQLANSSFYREGDKIVSLRAAITRIGLMEIVNSVFLYFSQKMLPKFPDIEDFSYNNFWSHALVCAIANRRLGHPNLEMKVLPGELYLTGLLHSMGKVLFAIHFPNKFSNCIKKTKELKLPLHQMEMDMFGTTDALVASKVLKFWNFPTNICDAVAFHQMPELAPPEHMIIAGLTEFAYSIAELSGIGCSGDGFKKEITATYLGQQSDLKIAQQKIQQQLILEILDSLEDKVENMLGISCESQIPINRRKHFGDNHSVKASAQFQTRKKGILNRLKYFLLGQ